MWKAGWWCGVYWPKVQGGPSLSIYGCASSLRRACSLCERLAGGAGFTGPNYREDPLSACQILGPDTRLYVGLFPPPLNHTLPSLFYVCSLNKRLSWPPPPLWITFKRQTQIVKLCKKLYKDCCTRGASNGYQSFHNTRISLDLSNRFNTIICVGVEPPYGPMLSQCS